MAPRDKTSEYAMDPDAAPSSDGFRPFATQKKQNPDSNHAILHRSLYHEPDTVSHASGIYLTLESGRKIIDACGGAAVTCIGHGNEEVHAAALSQMRKVSYVHTGAYTTTAAEALAHIILDGNPYGLERAFFVGSGSEAMDAALKLARQFCYEKGENGRRFIVARKQSYHGNTIGAMSVSSNLPRKIPYESLLLPTVSHVSPAYAYQYKLDSETEAAYVSRLATELDGEFHRLGPQNVIAFLAEPIVGATTGCVPAPTGYFRAVRDVCTKYGILLILDEVMCGMGRTGSLFAFEQEGEGVVPDIVTIGKGLGGGYAPIAGILVHKKVIDGLRAGSGMFNHGQTYQAHPLSCATALAVQTIIKREGLVERCKRMGTVLEKMLKEKLGDKIYVGDIRGRGMFWGIEFVRDRGTKEAFEPGLEFGTRVQRKAFDLGIAIYPGSATVDGIKGDNVLLAPPYTTMEGELWTIVKILVDAYEAVERDISRQYAKM